MTTVDEKEPGEVTIELAPPSNRYTITLGDANYVLGLTNPRNRFMRLLQALVGITWKRVS